VDVGDNRIGKVISIGPASRLIQICARLGSRQLIAPAHSNVFEPRAA